MTKVIHVHLLNGRKNYYFGSISAVYDVLTEDEVGIKKEFPTPFRVGEWRCNIK